MIKNRLSTFILMPFFMVVITTSLNAAPAITSITNVDPLDGREVFELTGSGYGFKAQAAPVIYDFGDYAFENGVYNDHQSSFADDFGIPRPDKDPDTLWLKASNESTTPTYLTHDNARVAGGTRNYRWGGPNSFLGWPRAYGGLTPPSDNEKLYMSWWFRTDYDQHEYYEFGFNNLIGSFDKGEKVTFQGTSVEAFVLGITDKQIALQITDSGGLKGLDWNGIDLLGNSSGATLTTNTIISSGGWWLSGGHGSTKFIRVWEDSAGKDGLRLSWTQDQLTTAGNDSQLRTYLKPNTWHHLEIYIDLVASTVERRVNSQVLEILDIGNAGNLNGSSPSVALIGFNGKQLFNGANGADIYVDSTPQRVLLANAAQWSDVTHSELQLPVSWSENQITWQAFYGSLDRTQLLYVYVIDENGVANDIGYPLSSGTSFAAPPPLFEAEVR